MCVYTRSVIFSSIIAMKMKWTPKRGCQFSLYEHPNRDQGVQEQLSENSTSTDRKWHRFISNVLLHETRAVYAGRELRGSPSSTIPPSGAGAHPGEFEQLQRYGFHNHSEQSSTIVHSHPYSKNHFLLLLNGVSCTFLCTLQTHRHPKCYPTLNTHLDPLALRPGAPRHIRQPQPRSPWSQKG